MFGRGVRPHHASRSRSGLPTAISEQRCAAAKLSLPAMDADNHDQRVQEECEMLVSIISRLLADGGAEDGGRTILFGRLFDDEECQDKLEVRAHCATARRRTGTVATDGGSAPSQVERALRRAGR